MNNTYAVVVTYHPDKIRLIDLVRLLVTQVSYIVIVDNTENSFNFDQVSAYCDECKHPLTVLSLGHNFGVAVAQNRGIAFAMSKGAQYVALFDQDSLPHSNMIATLLNTLIELQSTGIKVAAVGPRYSDLRQNNPPPFIRRSGLRVIRYPANSHESVVPVDYLISSGSLIPCNVFGDVGFMQESLFIDYIDIEWGLRAATLGYQSFGVFGAKMIHELGDSPISMFGMIIPCHSPLRHYYLVRNALYIYLRAPFPLAWKLTDFYRLVLKFGFYSLFAKPRFKNFLMMSKGALHGVLGKMEGYK